MAQQKLTQKSQEALQAAQGLAVRNSQQEVDTIHLLLALIEQEEGIFPRPPQPNGRRPRA